MALEVNTTIKSPGIFVVAPIGSINLQPQIKKVFEILNAMPAFKVFANIQEFDDYLWAELKKMDARPS